jgi:uncharacterized protein YraI
MWRKLWIAAAALALAVGAAVAPAASPAEAQGGVPWLGQYYNNPTLSDPIAVQRTDSAIAFNWGLGSPAEGMSADNFSVRWAQDVQLQPGVYRFFALADDNIRVTFNFGQAIIDTFGTAQIGVLQTADISVPAAGSYHIQVDYREVSGDAYAYVSYANAATNPQPNFNAPLPAPGFTNPWTVQYFNNTTLSGSPSAILSVGSPNNDWGTGQPVPSVGDNNWSARFTSVQNLPAGTYTASLRMDDGARLFVNGVMLIDQFGGATGQTYSANFALGAGANNFQIDFVEYGGTASLSFSVNQFGGQPTAAPQPTSVAPVPTYGNAIVTAFRLNVRANPAPSAPVITRVNRNESYPVTGRNASGTWYQIWVANQLGWVSAAYVYVANPAAVPVAGVAPTAQPTTPPVPGGYIVTATPFTVNIRSGPGTSFGRIGQIPVGQTARVVGRNGASTWWQVDYNGIVGWVTAVYAQMQPGVDVNTIPVTG